MNRSMKHISKVALMLNLSVAAIYAQQHPVRMTFSGNGAPSAIDLKHPGANTAEENVAGIGTLGSFTFRDLRAAATVPQPSSACAGLFFPTVAGGGIFRFQDGSLLKVVVTGGGDCIDLVHGIGHCTLTFQITGGTGRFQGVTGAPDVCRDCGAGIFRRLGHRPRHDHRNGGYHGNNLRSGRSGPIKLSAWAAPMSRDGGHGYRGRRPGWNDAEDPPARARVKAVCLDRSGERMTATSKFPQQRAKSPDAKGP